MGGSFGCPYFLPGKQFKMIEPFDPERDTPSTYRRQIHRFGGNNPYGGPMWRVCLAENCLMQAYGTILQMPDGDGGEDVGEWVKDKDGNDEYVIRAEIKALPIGFSTGWQWLPKYPGGGWCLEKWFPANSWGTPERWHAELNAQGEPLHGEFPSRGAYFIIGEVLPELPSLSDVENAIQMYLRTEAEKPTNFDRAMKLQLAQEKARQDSRRVKFTRALEQFHKSEILPVLTSPSLAAQQVRNELQEQHGRKSHLGFNEGFSI